MTFALRQVARRQFSSLAVYNYRLYFFGQMISMAGTWMQTTAQAWLVLEITGSPLALGTVTTLQFLPITVLSLFGGVFADRVPKLRLLITTQALSLVQAFILGLLVITGTVQLWHVYVLAFALGTLNAIDNPTRQSFVFELVGREQLVNAVALNSTIFNVARIAGPAIAGIAIAAVGMSMAFFLNAVSFVAVLVSYAMMRPGEFFQGKVQAPAGNVVQQLGEGLRYAVTTPRILYMFILVAFVGTFGFNFQVIIPLVAEFVLNVGPEKFGLLTSFLGAGSLISALFLAGQKKPELSVLLTASAAFVVLMLAIAFSTAYWLTAGLLFLLGAASLAFSNTANSSLQLAVPDHLRGRVMSIHFLLFAGTTPVGGFLLGYLSEHYGTRTAVATLALLTAAGIAAALTYRRTHASAFREPIPTAAGPVTAAATPVLSTATASEVSAAAPSSRLRS